MEREEIVEDRNERDRDPEESDAKQQRAIRAFFEFLNRHPDRRDHFIRSVVNAGTPKAAVERALDGQDLFAAAVMGDVERDAADVMDPLTTAAAANGLE